MPAAARHCFWQRAAALAGCGGRRQLASFDANLRLKRCLRQARGHLGGRHGVRDHLDGEGGARAKAGSCFGAPRKEETGRKLLSERQSGWKRLLSERPKAFLTAVQLVLRDYSAKNAQQLRHSES